MSKHASLANSPKISDWLDFSQEGELILHTGKVDIGQRITTALALIASEELSIPFEQSGNDRRFDNEQGAPAEPADQRLEYACLEARWFWSRGG